MEKRYSRNPEVVDVYFKVRRKKQNRFVWEFIQNESHRFFIDLDGYSKAHAIGFLTQLETHKTSNDHIILSSGTIGSGKFRDNHKYAKVKLNDPNFSIETFYRNKLDCEVFTIIHYWEEYKVCL